jgi:hypothetical protein
LKRFLAALEVARTAAVVEFWVQASIPVCLVNPDVTREWWLVKRLENAIINAIAAKNYMEGLS